MSYWVELHCDVNTEGICRGEMNRYPMASVSSARKWTMTGLKALEAQAQCSGWQRRRDGSWICPECAAHEEPSR